MVDRELTFSDPEMVRLLKDKFIPVAIDQWYQRKQNDEEGEFYRKVAQQGPRANFNQTTQGRYICSADGKLLGYNNNRGHERIMATMKKALAEFDPETVIASTIASAELDPRWVAKAPQGSITLRAFTRILDGYDENETSWKRAFQNAVGRDNVWLSAEEVAQLKNSVQAGLEVPVTISQRIARFHLWDNTRGEPPHWKSSEVKNLKMTCEPNGLIQGSVHLETSSGTRGYRASIRGHVEFDSKGSISRFDLLAKGTFWGEGRYTGFAPKGKFPLVVAIELADGSDVADSIAPHGTKQVTADVYLK